MSSFEKSVVAVSFILSISASVGQAQSWIPAGLSNKDVRVLAVDPHDSSNIYAGTFYQGFFKSTDGGLTWAELNLGQASYTAIQFDTRVSGVLYVLSYSGLSKSSNHGLNWTEIPVGPMCNHLVIDPQSPQILYLGAWVAGGSAQGGVLKSVNGGSTWTFMGLGGYDVIRLVIDPQNPLTIYAATDGGMFKSLDGGVTWTAINAGLTSRFCDALSLDPNAPETLYVGTWGGGVYKSTDGGASWSECNNGITNLNISSAEMDPHSSLNLCAATRNDIFLSTDGGASWDEKNAGLPQSNINSTALISSSPLSVYAGTMGKGVYLYSQKPYLSATPGNLNFGFISSSQKTPDRSFSILNLGGGTFSWTVLEDSSWVSCSPVSGNNIGKVKVSVDASGLPPGSYASTVSVASSEAFNTSTSLTVKLRVYAPGTDNPPIGFFDTPLEGSLVSGGVAVTGWALDDVELKKVEIKRDPDAADPPAAIGEDGLVFVGNALFVPGARPDVEAAFPEFPLNDRAGWGYLLLTYGLPRKGNGVFRIHAIAVDGTGKRTDLGTKTITSDNEHRVKPFGTIDTPVPGAAVSGFAYMNFGWVLTPPPNLIPNDGSTIWVGVDGVMLGHPVYGHYRADIAAAFPECLNANGGVGYFPLDTTGYANGLHEISWIVRDNAGNQEGIGSRFFEIMNPGSTALTQDLTQLRESAGLRVALIGRREQWVEELERVEFRVLSGGGMRFVGWGADRMKPLPVGSTLDAQTGVFSWMPGPGFLGRHVLHFAATDGQRVSRPVEVIVTITPKMYIKQGERKGP